ncbi:MAG TPA: hypothetical protein VMH26_14695 [Burkholderiales bacterium]|nr:hypothetical protein [Burkholderiales bacterium]
MKSVVGILALAAVIALVQGYARVAELSGSVHAGVVERVYVEQYPGIYVDRDTALRGLGGPVWVDVKFPEPLADGRTAAIAVVPRYMRVEPGDQVEMRFAGGDGSQSEAALDQNRVTTLLQRRHAMVEVSTGGGLSGSDHNTRALVGM